MIGFKNNYYLREHFSNRISARQEKQLLALDHNWNRFHKYQTEHVVHGELPPLEIFPPRDNSIEGLII